MVSINFLRKIFLGLGVAALASGMDQAAAATVVSTDHYQATLNLACAGGECHGDFAGPGLNRQLNITRISCLLTGSPGSKFDVGAINLFDTAGQFVFHEIIPPSFTSEQGAHSINTAVDLQVLSRQHMGVTLALSFGSGTAKFGFCTATGTLSILG